MVINLAYLHSGIDPDWLHTEHLKSPEAAKANVTKPSRHVHEQSQTPNRRAPLQHRHQLASFSIFYSPTEIQPVRLQNKTFFRNGEGCPGILFFHIERLFG